MTIYKLNSPSADTVGFIGSETDPENRVWIISGYGYTESDSVRSYAERKGYNITEVDEIPAAHQTAVDNLEAYPLKTRQYGTIDAVDPDSRFYFTGPDGHTQVDVRDVIAGKFNTAEVSN